MGDASKGLSKSIIDRRPDLQLIFNSVLIQKLISDIFDFAALSCILSKNQKGEDP